MTAIMEDDAGAGWMMVGGRRPQPAKINKRVRDQKKIIWNARMRRKSEENNQELVFQSVNSNKALQLDKDHSNF